MAEVPALELTDELKQDAKKPQPKDGHVAVRLHRNIMLFGGMRRINLDTRTKYYSMRAIWSYSLDIDRWVKFVLPKTQATPNPAVGRCAVTIGSDIYVHGGGQFREDAFDFKGFLFSSLWKLSGTADNRITWTKINFQKEQEIPSGRYLHCGWEYQNNLWIFGGSAIWRNDNFHARKDFQLASNTQGYTSQLCCFHPDKQIWKTVECSGSKPSPRKCHAITKTRAIIWIHGGTDINGVFEDLYEFDLCTLTWTQIQTVGSPSPAKCYSHSLTAISDRQIVLYGGSNNTASWILDLPSLSWRQHSVPTTLDGKVVEEDTKYKHTGTIGIHHVIIFGGQCDWITLKSSDILCVMFEPKSLLKSCLEAVHKQRSCLLEEWSILPRNLQAMLRAMCELSENDCNGNVADYNCPNCEGNDTGGDGNYGDAADIVH